MTVSRWQRRLLWYTAWLVWGPLVGYGISQGNLLLIFAIALPLFLVSLYFGLTKLVCPQCHYAVRTISLKITNCMRCGAAYHSAEEKLGTDRD